ncbi:MAG: FkbM family methyltransferase [Actinomycetia bacterium]|nr:FkbM family methyltransferase [Actinomycetes bacterium]
MVTKTEFISYAQNMEDVVLGRLVALVPNGCFIDVGAGHPILENVTYALYLKGWRGINVEPMQREVDMLCAERPDDETVRAAVGATMGSVTLFEAPSENRGATTSDAAVAADYEAAGETFVAFESPMVTLSSLLEKFQAGAVHVVKIDVEGMELDVLQSADLQRHRPWVVVVESTEPNKPTSTAHIWEHIVLEAGYRCTLFDGLNRFYVRTDLEDVAALLSVPANVFDHWTAARTADLRQEVAELRASFREAETYALALESALADLRAENEKASDKSRKPFGRART